MGNRISVLQQWGMYKYNQLCSMHKQTENIVSKVAVLQGC